MRRPRICCSPAHPRVITMSPPTSVSAASTIASRSPDICRPSPSSPTASRACDVSLNLRWPTAREMSGPWLRALAAGTADDHHRPRASRGCAVAGSEDVGGECSRDRGAGSGVRDPGSVTPSRSDRPVERRTHSLRLASDRIPDPDPGSRRRLPIQSPSRSTSWTRTTRCGSRCAARDDPELRKSLGRRRSCTGSASTR